MKALALMLALSSCTFTVQALDLHRTAPPQNICSPPSDPRCAAMFADLAAFTVGAYEWSTAERDFDPQYLTGATLMLGVLVGDAVGGGGVRVKGIATWKYEFAVVGCVLSVVVSLTGGGFVELLGAFAVLLSFGHAQVADRLAEREASRVRPSVECHRWATRYLVGKETLWLAYFLLHHSWSALAGVGLFLAYPVWRRFWRARKPLAAA